MSWQTATKEMSFLQLLLLAASMPQIKSKKKDEESKEDDKPQDFTTMIMSKM